MYSDEQKEQIGNAVCQRLSLGESLNKIAPDLGINQELIYSWVREQTEFAEKYARARAVQADVLAEQTVDIADDLTEDPASRRVRMDARKWFASKVAPKKYGDKLDVEHGGNVTVNVVSYAKPDDPA